MTENGTNWRDAVVIILIVGIIVAVAALPMLFNWPQQIVFFSAWFGSWIAHSLYVWLGKRWAKK